MAINLNTNPYYDDFDQSKNYLRILFKPGYAVQARELTQIQTNLQSQIARFGSHIFKDGSIVLNGSTTTNTYDWVVVEGATTTVVGESLVGKTIIGGESGATAKIIAYEAVSPTQARVFFSYQSGLLFERAEPVSTSDLLISLVVSDIDGYNGQGVVFSIDESVFFVNGHFVYCNKQNIVLNTLGTEFNKRVGIVVTESIVSSADDTTLLDPAQGSYNFAAPGADRIAISLELNSYEYDPLVDTLPTIDNFIELARFDGGKLVYKVSNASYSDIENTFARRTYDESGDYTVRAFSAKVVPHIRNESDKYSVVVGPGKAYVKGYEFETIAPTYVDIDRALDTTTKTNYSVESSFGDYFVIQEPTTAAIDYTTNPAINLISNGAVAGTANIRNIEYVHSNQYRLYVYNVKLSSTIPVRDVTDVTSGNWTAKIDNTFYTSGTNLIRSPNRTAIVKLPNDYIATLNPSGSSATEIEAQFRFPEGSGNITLVSETIGGTIYATATLSAPIGTTITSSFADEYIVVNQTTGAVIPVLSIYGSVGSSAKILCESSYATTAVRVYANVTYINKTQKSKVLNTVTLPATNITTNRISLGYSDCYKLVLIKAINSKTPAGPAQDVTALFDFDNGQTDELYDHGSVMLKPGQTISPSFDQIIITIQYLSHPSPNTGYFSCDSYPAEVGYDNIPTYTSPTGDVYRLTDCLDFRPRRVDGSTTIIGTSTAYPRSRISFDYSYYLPRVDKLVLTKERKLTMIKGVSSEQPQIPVDLYDAMSLYVFNLQPYTADPKLISSTYIDNRRYTMRDIGKIDKRVEKIEYYTALSFLEKQARDETIYDSLGVERFKNGILVDSFNGHSVGDVSNINYLCAINKESRTLRPRFSSYSFDYTPSSLGTASQQGDLLTAQISSIEPMVIQPYATGSINVNPFMVFKWDGVVTLNPATDTWIDTQTRPDVVVNLNGENDVYTTLVPNVTNPATSGVVWNDWQTVVRGIDIQQNLTNQLSQTTNVIDGKTIETTTSAISSSILTTSDTGSFRTGIQLSTSPVSTVQRDLGSKVVDISVVPYIRSRNLDFAARNLKPVCNLRAGFDGVDVTSYCTPAVVVTLSSTVNVPSSATILRTDSGSKTARILLVRGNVVHVIMNDGSLIFDTTDTVKYVVNGVADATLNIIQSVTYNTSLITSSTGDIAGTFLIPNNDNVRFTTGEKMFRLADHLGKNPSTAAEVKYVAQGLSQSTERTVVATRVATASVNPTQETVERLPTVSNSLVNATAQNDVDVTVIPDPIRILCSGDERTGDFSNGESGKYEYLLSYEHSFTALSSGTSGQPSITVPTQDAANIVVGMSVSGTKIALSTTVTAVNTQTGVITLSKNTTGSGSFTGVSAEFSNENPWVGIKFIPTEQPVRYTIYFEGREYTTGFLGSNIFNTQLNNLGLPGVATQTVGSPTTKLYFKRSNPQSTQARLIVESPLANTGWQFVVPSPLASDPAVAPPAPTYSIVADRQTVSEGSNVVFTVTTSGVVSGTSFTWSQTTGSTTVAADFDDGVTTGTVIVNNNTATITRPVKADLSTEGVEIFGLDLLLSGTVVARSQTVTIQDTSLTVPTYFISSDKTSVNEGGIVTFTITTTAVSNGTTLYWTTNGTTAAADYADTTLSGSFVVNSNTATITRTLVNDVTTEGVENFSLSVRTSSTSGTVVATSNLVYVNDTSPGPSYGITTSTSSVREGGSVTYTVSTTLVPNGTTMYWTASGGVVAADFINNRLDGTVVINNNTGTFSVTLIEDLSTEGVEKLNMALRLGSISGTVVATAPTVNVLDTSTTAATYFVVSNISRVNEGNAVTFVVTTTDVANGTTLWWDISGLQTADYTPTAGSFQTTNNSTPITITTVADVLTEGDEDFTLNVRATNGGTILATSNTVTVVDTSKTREYSIRPDTSSVNEGNTVTYTITTANVPNGTTLTWEASGTGITTGDFVQAALTGTATITNNIYEFALTATTDKTTEGPELLSVVVKSGSTVVATAPVVTIVDTSNALPTYSIVPTVTTVNEGSAVQFDISTTNLGVSNTVNLTYDIVSVSGSVTAGDFVSVSSLTGNTITITNNASGIGTASFTLTTVDDLVQESTESFNIELKNTGVVKARSSTVSIVNKTVPVNVTSRSWMLLLGGLPSTFNWAVDWWWVSGRPVLFDSASFPFRTIVEVPAGTVGFPSNVRYAPSIVSVVANWTVSNVYNTGTMTASLSTTAAQNVGTPIQGTLIVPNGVILPTSGGIITANIRWTYVDGDVDNRIPAALKTLNTTLTWNVSLGSQKSIDPVAQTFFVDAGRYPNGAYLKSADVFFATKSSQLPVMAQIRPTVNGYPSSDTILPFATSTLLPNQVNVPSTSAPNLPVATTFEFDNHVYLAPGQYALVVLANTDEYELYTATLGEFTIQDLNKRVDKQSAMGSLFKSQNGSTWTAVQEEDLMFTLNKCVFDTTTPAEIVMNTNLPASYGDIPYELFYTTGEVLDFANTDINTYYSLDGGSWIPYQLGSNISLPSQHILSSSDDVRLKLVLSTSNRDVSPTVDLNRLSSVLVHNIINNDSTGETTPDTASEGQSVAKYVTRKVKLAPGFEASDVKVFLFANTPSETSIKVYYKVSVSTDTFFDDNDYVEMEVESAGSYSENSFVEYKYKTPFTLNGNTRAIANGDMYDTFAIKIVMLSSTSAKIPQIRDLRVIALDD